MKGFILKLASWVARLLPVPCKRWLYAHPRVAHAVRRTLNAAAPTGLSEVTVAAGALAGCRMRLDLQSEKDYWLGTYEPELQRAAKKILKPGMVVYDAGANIGYISLMAARLVGAQGQVFAFEALPSNLARLQDHITLNDMAGRVQAIQAAVGNHVGETIFLAHASGAMGKAEGSAGRKDEYTRRLPVPALTLDHFVFKQGYSPPQVVKMDIEGGEGLALAGMERLLSEEARPTLLIELHGEQAARQVWQQLHAHGYQLLRMQRGYPPIEGLEQLDWKAYVIALPPGDRMH